MIDDDNFASLPSNLVERNALRWIDRECALVRLIGVSARFRMSGTWRVISAKVEPLPPPRRTQMILTV